jgi:hemolysin III
MKAFQLLEEYLVEHYPSRAERLADWWVHAVGLLLAFAGFGALLTYAFVRGDLGVGIATNLYALCLITMLGCSAAYNLTKVSRARPILRRLDEAAIFVMIAGSYTPFTTQGLDGAWAWSMTSVVWAIAAAGVAGKLLLPNISEKLWTLIYVAFGWVVVVALRPLIDGVAMTALILLAVGGLIYTTGALIFLKETLPFRRAIWHAFVVAAAVVHYIAIFSGVAAAGAR